MEGKSVTIKDIAEKAGVSKTTVSRYLNGRYEYMSGETRKTIEEVIAKTNYRPNAMAQGLKSKKSNRAAILLSDLGGQEISLQLKGICDVFVESGYAPVIYQTYNSVEKEREYLQSCIDQQVDGVLLIPSDADFAQYIQVVRAGMPIVLGDRYRAHWPFDAAYIDHYAAVTAALEYLWGQGCTKIAFITEPASPITTKMVRQQAFLDFGKKHYGFDAAELLYFVDVNGRGKGASMQDVIRRFAQRFPGEQKAVVPVTSSVLYYALQEIYAQKLRIPRDLYVCGYNSWGWVSLLHEDISILEQPMYELGRAGGRLLVERMKNGPGVPPRVERLEAAFLPHLPEFASPAAGKG